MACTRMCAQLVVLLPQGRVTISNDGATIMKLLDIVHPAAKVLADISMSQDAEVSDSQQRIPKGSFRP